MDMDIKPFDAALPNPRPRGIETGPEMSDLHNTEKLTQWVAIVAEIMILAVCLQYLLKGELLGALVVLLPLSLIIINQIVHLLGRAWPIAPYVILLSFALAQLLLAHALSSLVLIWAFPTLVGAFLITGTGYVHVYASIMLIGGTAISHGNGDMELGLRFAPAFAGMWMFLYILFQVLHGLRISAWKQSITDPLTGCYNRRYLDQFIDSRTTDGRAAMLLLDMDNFKQLNDEKGHLAGDRALSRLARLIQENWTSEVTCFRLGGDEFVLILQLSSRVRDNMSVQEEDRHLSQLARKITDTLNRDGSFSVSGGLVHFGWPCELDDIYRSADAALYVSKEQGRRRLSLGESIPPVSRKAKIATSPARSLHRKLNLTH